MLDLLNWRGRSRSSGRGGLFCLLAVLLGLSRLRCGSGRICLRRIGGEHHWNGNGSCQQGHGDFFHFNSPSEDLVSPLSTFPLCCSTEFLSIASIGYDHSLPYRDCAV